MLWFSNCLLEQIKFENRGSTETLWWCPTNPGYLVPVSFLLYFSLDNLFQFPKLSWNPCSHAFGPHFSLGPWTYFIIVALKSLQDNFNIFPLFGSSSADCILSWKGIMFSVVFCPLWQVLIELELCVETEWYSVCLPGRLCEGSRRPSLLCVRRDLFLLLIPSVHCQLPFLWGGIQTSLWQVRLSQFSCLTLPLCNRTCDCIKRAFLSPVPSLWLRTTSHYAC